MALNIKFIERVPHPECEHIGQRLKLSNTILAGKNLGIHSGTNSSNGNNLFKKHNQNLKSDEKSQELLKKLRLSKLDII